LSEQVRRWALLGSLAAAASLALAAVHAPTPSLLGPLVVGIAFALRAPGAIEAPPAWLVWAAGVVIGVTAGVSIVSSALHDLAADWAPVLGLCIVTLLLSIALGLALERIARLDRATALLGMLSGGAPAMIAIADDLDADVRLVAVVQYLRLLLIVALTPLVVDVIFQPDHVLARGGAEIDWPATVAVIAGCGVLSALARPLRIPGGAIVVSTVAAATVTATGLVEPLTMPRPLVDVALAVLGLEVGLRFTPRSLRQAGRLTPIAALLTATLIAVCGLLGVVAAELAGVTWLEGYLAGTPGGLSAVLAITLAVDVPSGFAVPVQVVRMLITVILGPLIIRWLVLRQRRGARARP
jgi:membrane AbrB-like protein